MAVVQPVPPAPQTVFVYPGGSDAPETGPLKATELLNETEPRKEQPRITTGLLLAFVIAIVANLAIIAMLANSGEPASTATAHAQEQPRPVPVAQPATANLATTFGEGKFLVGTDIAPGTYQTTGESGSLDCYWERLKDTSGATDSIIANNLGEGSATVTIHKSDAAFQTRWCNTWSKVS
ncbi:MAG: hypothetical protein ACRDSF_10075 [Pseudonocardiaceae bacterium]